MGGCLSFMNHQHKGCKTITHVGEEGGNGALRKSPSPSYYSEKVQKNPSVSSNESSSPESRNFSFLDLASATYNFRDANLIGQGGFGKVYRGELRTRQTVAIKLLDQNGPQGNKEFMTEVLMLSILKHPNLVNLFGYCTTGDQKALVYEYMPMGSLERYLFDMPAGARPLEWDIRMKIVCGAARGLEYLHCMNDPPVIHRDLKPANILLDENFNSKLSDFGLAKLGPVGDESHVSTRVMGTHGYCAPEYLETGKLTTRSDIYSFGVVLLEIITGKKAYDPTRIPTQKNLVNWARRYFKQPRKLVDPVLQGRFPENSLRSAMALCEMCLQEKPTFRPLISDICVGLEYVASQPNIPETYGRQHPW